LRAFSGFYGAGERNVAALGKTFESLGLRVFLGAMPPFAEGRLRAYEFGAALDAVPLQGS
jgi:hypothetical protein